MKNHKTNMLEFIKVYHVHSIDKLGTKDNESKQMQLLDREFRNIDYEKSAHISDSIFCLNFVRNLINIDIQTLFNSSYINYCE